MERRGARLAKGRIVRGASLVLAAAALSGCADLMARSAVAPAWFQSKAVEVKGEGYPDLHKVPKVRGALTDQATWEAEDKKLKNLAAAVDAGIGADIPDADTIRARAAQMRAQTDRNQPAPDSGTKP